MLKPAASCAACLLELSPQEASVLKLCAKGYEYKEFARLLNVRRSTIATCVQRVYQKLQVHSKTEAIYQARELGGEMAADSTLSAGVAQHRCAHQPLRKESHHDHPTQRHHLV
jgi:DNA-binding CsgD family transcriptional regulator